METDKDFGEYYAERTIIQYKNTGNYVGGYNSKAYAHIELFIEKLSAYKLLNDIQKSFDITTAVGVQLDIIGEYIGFGRDIIVRGPTGPITEKANDEKYRALLSFKIQINNMDSSLSAIHDYINYQSFVEINPPSGFYWEVLTSVQDVVEYPYMALRYVAASDTGQLDFVPIEELYWNDLLPSPTGVDISDITVDIPANNGFRTSSAGVPASSTRGFSSAGSAPDGSGQLAYALTKKYKEL